jgi:formamidopyrimidine-DNA glycosylase
LPELPEVETVKRGLQPSVEGRRLISVKARRADLRIPFPDKFESRISGRRVIRLWRRAKYILLDLEGGETLVIHLGMSGHMAVYTDTQHHSIGNGVHDHVVFETDAPACIVFTDHRRFGLMTLVDTASIERHKLFQGLGAEPLSADFDAARLLQALRGKKTPIKSALLDQRVVAGLGNIYVCEALWRAGISPKKNAGKIKLAQIEKLRDGIQRVLEVAIAAGGSTLRDHRQTNGELGYFQKSFSVYDREGQPCPGAGCPGTIRRIVQSGRSTFYCRTCQKM